MKSFIENEPFRGSFQQQENAYNNPRHYTQNIILQSHVGFVFSFEQ